MNNKIYTTRQGDTWDTIAKRVWNRETLMHEMMAANPDHGDVLVFGPDVELQVPQIEILVKTANLPPWFITAGGGS